MEVRIADAARETIMRLAPESADGRETGGILLGRGPGNDGVVHVEIAGDPGPHAIRRPDFFLRDLEHARMLAEEAWERSRAIWVGEWHTHPVGGPEPSATDLGTYANLLTAAALEFEVFASIIAVPGASAGWNDPRLCPWLLQIDAVPATHLEPVRPEDEHEPGSLPFPRDAG
jgi:integrative and conjugative element protein (TIGR02256 family)